MIYVINSKAICLKLDLNASTIKKKKIITEV